MESVAIEFATLSLQYSKNITSKTLYLCVRIWYNTNMGRIMALDVGDVRIGIAVSDIMAIIANPIESYTRSKTDINIDIQHIQAIVKERNVELIVCGLPISMNGQENTQSAKTRQFIDMLVKTIDVPVKFYDERLTSVSAERVLIQGNVRRENRKKVIDKLAATIILQNYLDSKR